jgi:hypothetical protein
VKATTLRVEIRGDAGPAIRALDRALYVLLCMELLAAGAMFTEGF